MRPHRPIAFATWLALITGITACGDNGGGGQHQADGPRTLQPADPDRPVPEGFERVECQVESGDRSLTVVLDVPEGAEPPDGQTADPGNSCWYFPQAEGVPEVHVVLLHDNAGDNDADDIATLEDLEAGFEDRVGEEAVDDVVWEQGVVVFGETVGNRLTWASEYEGIPEWNFRGEADGVQVWLTAQGEEFDGDEMEKAFEQVSASMREG